jgi:transposase
MDLTLVPKPSHLRSVNPSPAPAAPGPAPRLSGKSAETVPKPGKRRTFSAAEKLRIIKEADACLATGKRGDLEALLRREGIYSSHLSAWRMQLGVHGAAGLAGRKPGRKPKLTEAERRNVELTKRNAVLERKLRIANALIALQKKAHELLGLALPESDVDS